MRILKPALATLFGVVLLTAPAQAAEKVSFILNWVAGGDHAPVYWAKSQGWSLSVNSAPSAKPTRTRIGGDALRLMLPPALTSR